ncbi:GtrA family protein [Roseomonas sp. GCM10028921]
MLNAALLDRLMPPSRRALAAEFVRFGAVGTAGFMVDSLVLLLVLGMGAGLYGGRLISYIAAATTTFALNRAWTFRSAQRTTGGAATGRQWLLFLLVNLLGFAANYGTYAVLVTHLPLAAAYPVLGVAVGALAGMGSNFFLSRRYVFRR